MTNVVPGFPATINIAKAQAKRMGKALEGLCNLTHSQTLEIVAKTHGERSWGAMASRYSEATSESGSYDLGYRHVATDLPPPTRRLDGWKPDELKQLIDLLRSHPLVRTTPKYREMLDKVIAEGCVTVGSVDGLLDAASSKMGDFAFALHGKRLVELLGIKTESYLYRPSESDAQTIGFHAISVAGAAALMMKLERLGLDTHPEHLVSVVNKATAGRPMLTQHELDCLWYRSEKEGAGPQRLAAGAYYEDEDSPEEVFNTATGRRCSVYKDDAGLVQVLLVDPPA